MRWRVLANVIGALLLAFDPALAARPGSPLGTITSRGAVEVDGKAISRLEGRALTEARQVFGMVFQGAALFDSLTVFENVAFPLLFAGVGMMALYHRLHPARKRDRRTLPVVAAAFLGIAFLFQIPLLQPILLEDRFS